VIQTLIVLCVPWPTKLAVDYVLVDRPLPAWSAWIEELPGAQSDIGTLFYLALGVVGLATLAALLKVAYEVMRRSVGTRMSQDFACDTLERVQRKSLNALQRQQLHTGDLVQRIIVDTRSIEVLVFGVGLTTFQAMSSFVLMGGIILIMSGTLAALAIAVAIPIVVLARLYRDRLAEDAEQLATRQGSVSTVTEQMLSTLPEIQVFATEDEELRRFSDEADAQLDAAVRLQRTMVAFGVSTNIITSVGTGAVLLFGGLRVLAGSMTVGDLLVFIAYLASVYTPVEGLAYVTKSWSMARAGARRVLDLVARDEPLEEPAHPQPLLIPGRGASLTFRDVWFFYPAGPPVLRGIELEVEAGTIVALAGASGAGKTTMVSLIPRLFDPSSGTVEIAGRDLRECRLADVRRSVAIARQEPLLLPSSVRENIRYGSPHATDDRVEAAAEQALAARFIRDLPDGYDTVIGERGLTLSGGQRQRLSIARALCRDTPIIVLDEPTAALDSESETELLDLLAAGAHGRTILIVAHRLSTLRRADRILLMDHGRIVEDGKHVDLLAAGGRYAHFNALQVASSPASTRFVDAVTTSRLDRS
jgi:ATP-binding cassette subfamily B protein/subfamily B ATP-binding cassette protein MsbA